MTAIFTLYDAITGKILALLGGWFLPTLARFSFAAVLFMYFWNSAKTKLGDGIFGLFFPNDNAYMQIFPQKMDAYGYDISQFSALDTLVVTAGTVAEIALPLMILFGLMTRLAALGMIGFILVQSLVDVTGHMVDAATLGRWFDGASGSLIMDQRLMWVVALAILFVQGGGPLSLDRLLRRS